MAQSKPVKTFRFRGISASVFENTTHADNQPVRFFKVSLQRAFKQDGEFKHNSSFGRDDIPVAMHVLAQRVAIHPRPGGGLNGRDNSRVISSSHTTGRSLPGRRRPGVGFISFHSFVWKRKRRTSPFTG